MKHPKNENYCATIVEIKNIITLENCDNVVHTNIFGNLVVVSKDTKVGDVGIFFPPETQISKIFLTPNNLYRNEENNADKEKKGFFEEHGRVKTVKFRGNMSMGFFIPIESLKIAFGDKIDKEYFKIGASFDEVNGQEICRKYVVRTNLTAKTNNDNKKKKNKKKKKGEEKLIDNQFRFHTDTAQLAKNIHKIKPDDIISVTFKCHGSSIVSSRLLCKKKLNPFLKLLKKVGVPIIDTHYDWVYSSRKVIKNPELNPNANHYYDVDVWGKAHDKIKDYLADGMTFYAEIVGYIPNTNDYSQSSMIQSDYDYGCEKGQFDVYIYRITYTNPSGKVFEFSVKQVQDFCKMNGIKAVPELYYGRAIDLDPRLKSDEHFQATLLEVLKEKYLEKQCFMCKNKVPEEGCVVRIEGMDLEAFKLKSFNFLERETKLLDKGQVDIEEEQKGSEDEAS